MAARVTVTGRVTAVTAVAWVILFSAVVTRTEGEWKDSHFRWMGVIEQKWSSFACLCVCLPFKRKGTGRMRKDSLLNIQSLVFYGVKTGKRNT